MDFFTPPNLIRNTACIAHYSKLNALESMLQPSGIVLWAARYGHFKDKKEYVWAMDVIRPHLPDLAQELGEEYDPSHHVHPYILSLSNYIDNKTMWEKYGDNNRGIMLIFDRLAVYGYCQDVSESTNTFRICMDVTYATEDNIYDRIAETYNKFQDSGFADISGINCFSEVPIFVKSEKDYSFEGEYRIAQVEFETAHANPYIFFESPEAAPKNLKLRIAKKEDAEEYDIKPYVEIFLPKHTLVGVCLGPEIATRENERALNLYLKSKGYTAKIFRSNI